MISKILSCVGIITSTLGTIITLWSVISITQEKFEHMQTCEGQDNRETENSIYQGKPYAIVGIIVIVIGAALQIIALFC